MKWDVLTEDEKVLVRERGLDPEPMVVSRVSADTLWCKDLKTQKEVCIRKAV